MALAFRIIARATVVPTRLRKQVQRMRVPCSTPVRQFARFSQEVQDSRYLLEWKFVGYAKFGYSFEYVGTAVGGDFA